MEQFNAKQVKDQVVQWIRDWFEENGKGCNAVLGVSGGKDSSVVAALCAEEVACNTLQWGYSERTDCAVDIRTVCRDEEITIRFRDSGRHFNPESYISQVLVKDRDPARNIGLRIVSNISSKMQYMCIVDCNILLIHIR